MIQRIDGLSDTDWKVIELLSQDGRIDLASKLKLSGPSAADRVRKLEQRKIIRGYAALCSSVRG
jgi:Lrp/AsnC family leucine-responsive transcriptional regulator